MGNPRVGFKHFRWFVEKFSAGIKRRAEEVARQAGRPFEYRPAPVSKEARVINIQEENPVRAASRGRELDQ